MFIHNKLRQKVQKIIILVFFLVAFIYVPIGSKPLFQGVKDQKSSEDYLDLKMSGPEINITTPENKTYLEPITGYYPGTWSFDNDPDGTIPQGWIDNSQALCTARVVSEKVGHKKVVHLDDDSGNKIYFDNIFPSQTYGSIELWILAEDASTGFNVRTANTTSHMFYIAVDYDKWQYVDSTDTVVNIPAFDGVYDPVDNTWYHLTIHFRCDGAPSYMGLNENKYKVVIDGIESGELEARTNTTFVNTLDFATGAVASTDSWVDAVGFSWNIDYALGDNINEGLLLNFDTSFNPDWLAFSLDGANNKSILGDTTIPFPSNGDHNIQVFGNNSIGEMFESDKIHFTIEHISIDVITPENISYTNLMSGYYPATYGFEDELVGTTGLDIGFLDAYEASTNCYITITSELDSHKNILRVYDNNAGTDLRTQFFNYFGNKGSGSIEFWIRTTDATLASHVRVYSSTDDYIIQFKIEDDRIQTNDVATWANLVNPAANNQWYHIRFDLESTTGGYQGLSQYEYYVYVDGVRYGAFGFQNNVIPYKLFIGSLGIDGGYSSYYDAISYSWDADYDIGDNINEGLLISYTNSSALEWIGYSLDGQANKTVTGNTVIPMPGNGAHTMQIHGTSTIGHYYSSALVYFTVDISEEPPPPPPNGDNFMLIFILISVFSVVGVTIAIVVVKKVHTPSKAPKPRKPKVKKEKPKKKGIIEEELFCPFCNTAITPQHKFCTYCGSNLIEKEEL
jgi:hypothetical protein